MAVGRREDKGKDDSLGSSSKSISLPNLDKIQMNIFLKQYLMLHINFEILVLKYASNDTLKSFQR